MRACLLGETRMRWGVRDRFDQRIAFVIRAASGKESLTGLCNEFEISRPTGYLWLKRYREAGCRVTAVVERSRRPQHSPQRTQAGIEAKVVELRQQEGW